MTDSDPIRIRLEALGVERGLTLRRLPGREYKFRLGKPSGGVFHSEVYGDGATEEMALRATLRSARRRGWL